MEDISLKDAKRQGLVLLDKLDSVCKKNNVKYFLETGTLLGAVRHKGFIPWDDDIDVVFTPENYLKLLEIPAAEWGKDFIFVSFKELNKEVFYDFFSRLIYVRENLPVRYFDKMGTKAPAALVNRASLDCVRLENAPNSILSHYILLVKLTIIYGMLIHYRAYIDFTEYGIIGKIAVFILSKLGRFVSLENLLDKYEKTATLRKEGLYYYRPFALFAFVANRFKREWYEKTSYLKFEGRIFPVPEK